jgi:leukotriene-A4 hydrolase
MTRVHDQLIEAGAALRARTDPHSYSEPEKFRIRHLELDLEVSFDSRTLKGTALLALERQRDSSFPSLVLDTYDLDIRKVEAADHSGEFRDASFTLGAFDPILGAPLIINVPPDVRLVKITYTTSPHAGALHWVEPAQTAGKRFPFLSTQSQEIHARSWIPLQDTPSVRLTYAAEIRTRSDLSAVMSAESDLPSRPGASHRFRMNHPIPPYLIALAVGDIEFASTGPRTGVYADPALIEAAKYEFAEAEQMLEQAEQLYGTYLWGRFDILVLPPSFPFGGMENPSVIFVTPTLIAGDRSAVSVISHELAHAWSGNLVTNATWSDFWLNEGFTTYIEHRLQERLYGKHRADMEQVLARERLEEEMERLPLSDQILHIDLNERDPDAGATLVPYVKGALFLKSLEEIFGRSRLDAYLRAYFNHFAFRSVTTAQAISYLKDNLFRESPDLAARVPLHEWIFEPGLPKSAPRTVSQTLNEVKRHALQWIHGQIPLDCLQTQDWSAHEWLYFLTCLPADLGPEKMRQLDSVCHLTQAKNAEILQQWLLMAIRNRYTPAYPRLEAFLATVGRRIYIKPLFEELVKTEDGKRFAQALYSRVRGAYHPLSQATVDSIVAQPDPIPDPIIPKPLNTS